MLLRLEINLKINLIKLVDNYIGLIYNSLCRQEMAVTTKEKWLV